MPRKPKQSRSIATVDAIVEAGFICLSRHGLAGTTTNHIAAVAGLSSGSVYEYFSNKEEIFEQMGERFLQDVTQFVSTLKVQLPEMEIPDVIRVLSNGFCTLLMNNDRRYLYFVQYVLLPDSREFTELLSRALNDLAVQYLMNHPRYMRIRNLNTMVYIVINAGIYNTLLNLSSESPPVKFDALVDGFVNIVTYYVDHDLMLQDKNQSNPAA